MAFLFNVLIQSTWVTGTAGSIWVAQKAGQPDERFAKIIHTYELRHRFKSGARNQRYLQLRTLTSIALVSDS